jgi:predicted ABC-type transport system involved in lysophospholipase L1 biosynthesis ATPase subunit
VTDGALDLVVVEDPGAASAAVADLLVEATQRRELATLVVAHDDAVSEGADRRLVLEAGRLRASPLAT